MTTSSANSSTNRQAEMFAGSTAMMAEPSNASDTQNPDVPHMGASGGDDTTGSTGGQAGGNSGSGGDPSQPGATSGGDTGNSGGGSSGGMTGSPASGGGTSTAGGDGGTGSSGGGGTATAGSDGGSGSPSGGGTGTTGGDGGVHLPGIGDLPVVGDLGGLGLGNLGGILNPVAGAHAPLQPVLGAANTLVNDVNQELGTLGHTVGLSQITDAATGLLNTVGLGDIGGAPAADGHTNLVTDVLNAPGSILDGGLMDSVSHIGADLSDTINAVSSLKDSAIFGSDPSNPVSDLVSGIGHDLQSTPLLTLNGGNNASDGGLLGGGVGSLNGSSSGHLVDVDAGPQQDNGLNLNLLNEPGTGSQHTAEVHAVDVGPTGPQLLDLGLLTGGNGVLSDGGGVLSGVTGALSGGESPLSGATGLLSDLHIPTLGGTGADGLAGNLLGGSNILSGNSTSAPVTAPVDVDAGHDLGSLIADHGALDLHGTHII